MCCEADTEAAFRAAGLKRTVQRLLIACTVRHIGGHVTAGRIMDEVRATQPAIDISTVYRTLAALRRSRLVTQTAVGGEFVFEWAESVPHHHLICTTCGRTIDIPHQALADLEQSLLREHHFAASLDHLAIPGRCLSCGDQSASMGDMAATAMSPALS